MDGGRVESYRSSVGHMVVRPADDGNSRCPKSTTKACRPPSQSQRADPAAADAARLAGSAVNKIPPLEISRPPLAVDIIAKRASALSDGVGQSVTHRVDQACKADPGNSIGRAGRTNPCPKQCFIGVDVSHADYHVAVHQGELDRGAPRPGRLKQVLAVESTG